MARVRAELALADEARASGNEGRARVCARRAASWTVKEYLARKGIEFERVSGYGHINFLAQSELVGAEVKEVLGHMTLSMAKDDPAGDSPAGESYWPLEADLVAEARWLIRQLFEEAGV